ncbi:hypothetical protein Q9966_016203 [Columba livia]|nr:hypothetical protein Q9966_016203 [Columba livia]
MSSLYPWRSDTHRGYACEQEEENGNGESLSVMVSLHESSSNARILFPPEKICMAWQHSQRAGAGLHNLGNTCFLNSVLQCLTYTPPLANHLLSGEHSQACGQKGFCMMCRMDVHVQQVLHSSASAIEPWAVIDFLTVTCWSCQAVSDSYEAFLDVPLDIKVVEHPQYLDLRPYTSQAAGEPLLYSLYAVLVHGGGSCHAGHYFCYIKASDGLWYHMDDETVDLCDSDTVLRQQAYLLFYIRNTGMGDSAIARFSVIYTGAMEMKEDVQAGRVSWRHDVDIRSWRSSWNFRNITFYTGRQPPLLTRVAAGGTSYFADIRRPQNGRIRENLPFPAFPKCTDVPLQQGGQERTLLTFRKKPTVTKMKFMMALTLQTPEENQVTNQGAKGKMMNLLLMFLVGEQQEEKHIAILQNLAGDGNTCAALNNAKKGGESSGRRVPAERIPRSNWRSFDNGGIHFSDPNGNYQQRRKNKDDETASAVPYVRATSRKTDSDSLEPRRSTYVFYRTVNAAQGPKFSGSTGGFDCD